MFLQGNHLYDQFGLLIFAHLTVYQAAVVLWKESGANSFLLPFTRRRVWLHWQTSKKSTYERA